MLLNQALRRLTETREFDDGQPVPHYKQPLLLMLDEFPALGRLAFFQESLAYLAGYGIRAFLIQTPKPGSDRWCGDVKLESGLLQRPSASSLQFQDRHALYRTVVWPPRGIETTHASILQSELLLPQGDLVP